MTSNGGNERDFRVKMRKYTFRRSIREDIDETKARTGLHKFYRLEMPFVQAIEKFEQLSDRIEASRVSSNIDITSLTHPEETINFMFLYNAIFIAAPDPSRTITMKEAGGFPSERTFIAHLWHSMAGFIYLTVEKDPITQSGRVGAIAGIGVLPKYRGKKIGLALLKRGIEYFKNKNVSKLICEVYEHNQPSMKMFQGLGMKIVGEMILEEEQPERKE